MKKLSPTALVLLSIPLLVLFMLAGERRAGHPHPADWLFT